MFLFFTIEPLSLLSLIFPTIYLPYLNLFINLTVNKEKQTLHINNNNICKAIRSDPNGLENSRKKL